VALSALTVVPWCVHTVRQVLRSASVVEDISEDVRELQREVDERRAEASISGAGWGSGQRLNGVVSKAPPLHSLAPSLPPARLCCVLRAAWCGAMTAESIGRDAAGEREER
jgi:hypothetical protein